MCKTKQKIDKIMNGVSKRVLPNYEDKNAKLQLLNLVQEDSIRELEEKIKELEANLATKEKDISSCPVCMDKIPEINQKNIKILSFQCGHYLCEICHAHLKSKIDIPNSIALNKFKHVKKCPVCNQKIEDIRIIFL